jgi:hypothetical protein
MPSIRLLRERSGEEAFRAPRVYNEGRIYERRDQAD